MSVSLLFIRLFFIFISMFFMTTYNASALGEWSLANIIKGVIFGGGIGGLLISLDVLFRKFRLRSLNVLVVGLFCGYLLGQGVISIFNSILSFTATAISYDLIGAIHTMTMLVCTYFGIIVTWRSSEEFNISIPFVKLQPLQKKNRTFIVTPSLLCDSRTIDLATSGFLDNCLIIPRFVIQELQTFADSSDEQTTKKGHHGLGIWKKLESQASLNFTYDDTFIPEAKTCEQKLSKLSKLLSANILTSEMADAQFNSSDDYKVINIQSLANAFKPLLKSNESLSIKIQRYGKEPRQGVGYLDDGTMVVINGGGEYIGQVIDVQVLSVKHTSSGRIIFCNVSTNYESEFLKKTITTTEEQHITI
jgi:uncharacterized protein YacL